VFFEQNGRRKLPTSGRHVNTGRFRSSFQDVATSKEISRLQDLFEKLDWSQAMVAALENVVRHYRSLVIEAGKAAPTMEGISELELELRDDQGGLCSGGSGSRAKVHRVVPGDRVAE